MKRIISLSCLFVLLACNNGKETKTEAASTSQPSAASTTETVNYPIKAQYSQSWEAGDPQNVVKIMSVYKAWDDGNLESFKALLADSLELYWATGDVSMGTKDSMYNFIANYRNQYSEIKDEVHAVIGTYHKDTKENWVMVWTKEVATSKKGKKDSVELQEDWRINSDGKIDRVYQYNATIKPMK